MCGCLSDLSKGRAALYKCIPEGNALTPCQCVSSSGSSLGLGPHLSLGDCMPRTRPRPSLHFTTNTQRVAVIFNDHTSAQEILGTKGVKLPAAFTTNLCRSYDAVKEPRSKRPYQNQGRYFRYHETTAGHIIRGNSRSFIIANWKSTSVVCSSLDP